MSAPEPDRTLTTPGGKISARISAKRRADSGVRAELCEQERRHRCLARRLQDDGIPGRERRTELPGGHVQRVVPRRDRGDHADRVAPDDRGVTGNELVGGKPVHHPGGAGEEAEEVGTRGHLVDRGPDRLAGVRALESTELVGVRVERVCELQQQERTILRGRLLVALEGLCRRLGRAVDVLLGARGHAADDLVVGGIDDVRRAAVGRLDELTADELPVGLDSFEGVGHRGPPGSDGLVGRVLVIVVPRRKSVP